MTLNTIPLNASGYFSTLAEENFNLANNVEQRRRSFQQLMRDLGMRSVDGELRPDWSNRFGAFAEGYREAAANTAGRGYGPSRDMRRMTFAPTRSEIVKQSQRARDNMIFDNQADRQLRKMRLAAASRNAAQYGYEQRQPREGR